MTSIAIKEKGVAFVPVLALNSFAKYSPEKEHITRKAEVKKDRVMEELKQLYNKTKVLGVKSSEAAYKIISASLKNHNYSAKDIDKFSIALAELQGEAWFDRHAGLLLSSLINNGKENDYVIHSRHPDIPINSLGYKNTKNIIVEGNGGDLAGVESEGGTMTVKGDADIAIGYRMKSGIIIVEGNVRDCTGAEMKGGEIHIEGETHIEAESASISVNIVHGKIYYKGKLIVDK